MKPNCYVFRTPAVDKMAGSNQGQNLKLVETLLSCIREVEMQVGIEKEIRASLQRVLCTAADIKAKISIVERILK